MKIALLAGLTVTSGVQAEEKKLSNDELLLQLSVVAQRQHELRVMFFEGSFPLDSENVFKKLEMDTERILNKLVESKAFVKRQVYLVDGDKNYVSVLIAFAHLNGAKYGKLSAETMLDLTMDQIHKGVDGKPALLDIRIPKEWAELFDVFVKVNKMKTPNQSKK